MKRTFVLTVIALTAASIALGQKKSASKDEGSSVEQAIKQVDNERIQAQIHADAAALDRIYADDFIGIGPSGTVRTKRQVLLKGTHPKRDSCRFQRSGRPNRTCEAM